MALRTYKELQLFLAIRNGGNVNGVSRYQIQERIQDFNRVKIKDELLKGLTLENNK